MLRGDYGGLTQKKIWLSLILLGVINMVCYYAVHGRWYFYAALLLPLFLIFIMKAPYIFPFGLFVFALPLDFILVIGGKENGATYTMLLGSLSVVALAMNGLLKRKLINLNNAVRWHWLFVLWALVSIAWAMDSGPSLKIVFTIASLISLYTVVSMYNFKQNEYEFIKKAMMYGGLAASIVTIYSYLFLGVLFGDDLRQARGSLIVGDMVTDPNDLAFGLLAPFAVCFYQIIISKKFRKKLYYLLIALTMVYAATVSGSRGGILGMVVIVLVTIYYSPKKSTALIGILACIAFAVLFAPETLSHRMNDAASSGGAGRLGIWMVGWEAFKHNTFGVGLDNFPIAYGHYVSDVPGAGVGLDSQMGAHNIFLQILVEFGPIGLIVFSMLLIKNFKLLNYEKKFNDAVLLKAAFIGMVAQSLTLGVIWRKQFWLIFMMISIYYNIARSKKADI